MHGQLSRAARADPSATAMLSSSRNSKDVNASNRPACCIAAVVRFVVGDRLVLEPWNVQLPH